MNSEDLARFLKYLSPDEEEAGCRFTRLHKKLTGFFSLNGDSDPESAAHVTIDRAASKISAGAVVPNVDYYCLGIARNILKERRRITRRENLAFHEFIQDLNNFSSELVERIHSKLKPCFEQLDVDDQDLLRAYCQNIRGRARAEHRRQLAETRGMTVLAIRVKVTRLRTTLMDCVRKQSNDE